MSPYQIDGVPLHPQPNSHEWRYPNVLGNDASGAPFYSKYVSATLRCDLTVGYHQWFQYLDGGQHTVTLPAPGSHEEWTDYASVYCQIVEQGVVGGAHKSAGGGVDGITLEIVGIELPLLLLP